MRFLLSAFCAVISLNLQADEFVSFWGKAIKQTYLPDVAQTCPEGHICMDVVYRWTIQVDKLISGNLPGKKVQAARIQHTEFINAHKHQALYVLSRIEDEDKRKLLGADYWLEEYSPPRTLYCLSSDRDFGLEDKDAIGLFSGTQSCYVKHDEN